MFIQSPKFHTQTSRLAPGVAVRRFMKLHKSENMIRTVCRDWFSFSCEQWLHFPFDSTPYFARVLVYWFLLLTRSHSYCFFRSASRTKMKNDVIFVPLSYMISFFCARHARRMAARKNISMFSSFRMFVAMQSVAKFLCYTNPIEQCWM